MSNQQRVIEALVAGNVRRAREFQKKSTAEIARRLRSKPSEPSLRALDGVNKKNEYLIRHWEAAGAD